MKKTTQSKSAKLNILIISRGEFSGTKNSLVSTIRKQGCHVIEEKISLKFLQFRFIYLIFMLINSIVLYGFNFRKYINRTYAAYFAFSKVNHLLISKHKDIDAVILIGVNSSSFWKYKYPYIMHTIFTDHINLLSKRLSDYSLEIPEKKVHPSWNRIERKILSEQDHLFVMSGKVKRSMVEDYGIVESKISVVGGGPNLEIDIELGQIRKDYSGRRILFVGLDRGNGYVGRKGLPVLKSAFVKVRDEFPDASLHIAGVEGINSSGIHYYGKLGGEQLKKAYFDSQILVLPAFRESFGIVLLEAMWSKSVCIGSNIEAIPEIIEDGGSGYLVEPGDVEGLADKITGLFREPSLMMKMGERGYQLAQEKWTWEKSVHKILEVLVPAKFYE